MSLKYRVSRGVLQWAAHAAFQATSRCQRAVRDYPDDPEQPWLSEYAAFGVPASAEPYPDVPLHQLLVEAAADHPESGLLQRGRNVTYPDVLADAERLATALADRGVEPGDRVATILPTSVQFAVVDAAVSMAGGVHVPNDFLDARDDLAYRIRTADANVLIGNDEHADLVCSLAESADVEDVLLATLADNTVDQPDHDPRPEADRLSDVVAATARDPPAVDVDPATDVHVLLFTGGTTGAPKGVRLTHRNVVANVHQASALTPSVPFGDPTTLLAQPTYHAYGYTTLHGQIHDGASVALVDDARDVEEMARLVETHGIRLVSGVPTQFMDLLEERVDRRLLAVSGSAPLADEVREEFAEDNLGITQGYGLSEMSPTTHVDLRGMVDSVVGRETAADGLDHPCIGIPLPDTEIKLVDVDTGEEIPVSEAVAEERAGELYLDGPQRMRGYLDQTDPFDDGFVPTGDVVQIDPNGRFYVVDRVKDIINVSGLKVYPRRVDEVLYELDAVRRPATVGVPDPERPGSERVAVFIELEPAAALTAEDVRDHLDGRVAAQAMPQTVSFVEEVPLTDVGKVDKQALRTDQETVPP